jgi:hypothetical protein
MVLNASRSAIDGTMLKMGTNCICRFGVDARGTGQGHRALAADAGTPPQRIRLTIVDTSAR